MPRSYAYHSALLFAVLLALLLPFPWQLASFQQHLLPRIFGAGLYSSDSPQQGRLYAVLAGAAWLLALLLRKALNIPGATRLLRALLTAYLAAVLARYGADKLLKTQFYLPEPSTLYTPFGKLDKDILYWSTLGTSRPYNLFLGGTELLAAVLLLVPRMRRAALLLSASIFLQVLAVDLCFGIGVRLFSAFLLLLTLTLLAPDARAWLQFLSGKPVAPAPPAPAFAGRLVPLLKALAVLAIGTEALLPALRSGNWNDDTAARPPLHGAYEVSGQAYPYVGGLPLARRLFVHRAGYLVLQDRLDRLHSFPLSVDTVARRLLVKTGPSWRSYPYTYGEGDSVLTLYSNEQLPVVVLRARALPWRALPALR